MQVRCFLGDNEQRWMMWYSGHSRQPQALDALYPAAGSAGTGGPQAADMQCWALKLALWMAHAVSGVAWAQGVVLLMSCTGAGLAISGDGIDWERGAGDVETTTGEQGTAGLGRCLPPNGSDWWWLDTCHLTVSDVQVCSRCTQGEQWGLPRLGCCLMSMPML